MDVWREDAALWWAAASEEQKRAVMAVIRVWGMDQADHPDLEPGDSRRSHWLLAEALKAKVPPDADHGLLRGFYEQPPVVRAEWVQAVGREFEPGTMGAEVAREVSLALAPPPFREMKDHEQAKLLGQIAQEVGRKLQVDPAWYGKQQSRPYHALSRSLHELLDRAEVQEGGGSYILWSHMEPKVREGLLGEIGEFARKLAQSPGLAPDVQEPLADLGRAVQQILAPERVR